MSNSSIKFSRNDLITSKGQIKLPFIHADKITANTEEYFNARLAEIITKKTEKGEKEI